MTEPQYGDYVTVSSLDDEVVAHAVEILSEQAKHVLDKLPHVPRVILLDKGAIAEVNPTAPHHQKYFVSWRTKSVSENAPSYIFSGTSFLERTV